MTALRLYTCRELAALWGISVDTVRKWVRDTGRADKTLYVCRARLLNPGPAPPEIISRRKSPRRHRRARYVWVLQIREDAAELILRRHRPPVGRTRRSSL